MIQVRSRVSIAALAGAAMPGVNLDLNEKVV